MRFYKTEYADIRYVQQMLDFYERLLEYRNNNRQFDIYMQDDYVICADIYESKNRDKTD